MSNNSNELAFCPKKRSGSNKIEVLKHNVILGVELAGEYDYIVVGAGSAGVAVARRLADEGM